MTGQALEDPGRLDAIERSGLIGEMSLEALERVSRLVTHVTGAPLALVNVVDDAQQTTITGVSALARFATTGITPLSNSLCQNVVTGGAPLVVADARADDRDKDSLGVTEDGVIAYLGVPLYAPSGHILGALCAVDEQPREWTRADQRAMDDLGGVIADQLALRDAGRKIDTLVAELAREARHDALTGLGNRRLWEEHAAIERNRAEREGTMLSVVVFDLDGFKAVNDDRGHAAGDALLRDLAQAWSPLVRLPDVLARIGGDEFGVLLPGSDAAGAEEVAERLVRALPTVVSASFGVAEWRPPEPFEALTDRADTALYALKRRR